VHVTIKVERCRVPAHRGHVGLAVLRRPLSLPGGRPTGRFAAWRRRILGPAVAELASWRSRRSSSPPWMGRPGCVERGPAGPGGLFRALHQGNGLTRDDTRRVPSAW